MYGQYLGDVWTIYGQIWYNYYRYYSVYSQCFAIICTIFVQFRDNIWLIFGQYLHNIWTSSVQYSNNICTICSQCFGRYFDNLYNIWTRLSQYLCNICTLPYIHNVFHWFYFISKYLDSIIWISHIWSIVMQYLNPIKQYLGKI